MVGWALSLTLSRNLNKRGLRPMTTPSRGLKRGGRPRGTSLGNQRCRFGIYPARSTRRRCNPDRESQKQTRTHGLCPQSSGSERTHILPEGASYRRGEVQCNASSSDLESQVWKRNSGRKRRSKREKWCESLWPRG